MENSIADSPENKRKSLPGKQIMKAHPAAFKGHPFKPLRIGILEDLIQAHDGEFSKILLKRFMSAHTSRRGYLLSVAAGGPRYALDGSVDGVVSQEEQEYACERIAVLDAKSEAKHMAIKQRSLILKAFEASGLGRSEYAKKSDVTLEALCSDLDKAVVERAIRMRDRLRVVEKLEKSGLSPEEFSAREKISLTKLMRIMVKVTEVRPVAGSQ